MTLSGAADAQNIPARLDRLPWSRWHWRIVLALGAAWLLGGFAVTLAGTLASTLQRPDTLALSDAEFGWIASVHGVGAILGALLFGHLADRLGRKRLLLLTLSLYTTATVASAFAFDSGFFALTRFVAGLSLGGGFAAIYAAIAELVPARVRGRASLALGAGFWLGAALGGVCSQWLLDVFGPRDGWRAGFALGGLLAIAIPLVRRHVPESPRWLLAQGHAGEARRIVARIELEVASRHGTLAPVAASADLRDRTVPAAAVAAALHALVGRFGRRSLVVLTLMVAQAFFYDAIVLGQARLLTRFQRVPETRVGLYVLVLALAAALGPLLLGPLFDRAGRRRIIALTCALSTLGLALTGWVFAENGLDARRLTLCCSVVFFFASAAASSAYLTASEVFPLEMRAFAIGAFHAVGMLVGGFAAPALFETLAGSGDRGLVAIVYAIGAALMLLAGLVAWRHAAAAERAALERIAPSRAADAAYPPHAVTREARHSSG
ncbi:MAG TPA: MFS transporter [Burkholderiaceae bacterium]